MRAATPRRGNAWVDSNDPDVCEREPPKWHPWYSSRMNNWSASLPDSHPQSIEVAGALVFVYVRFLCVSAGSTQMAKFNLGASGDAIRLFLIVWAPTQRPLPIGRRSKDPPWGLAACVCRSPQARRRSDEEPIREPLCVEIGTHLFPLSAWFDGRGHWPGCDPLRVLHRVVSSIAVSVGPVRFSLDTFWALVGPLTRPSQMGSGGNLKWTGELQRLHDDDGRRRRPMGLALGSRRGPHAD